MTQGNEKYSKFVDALKKLCIEHKVALRPSMYDDIDVWDLVGNEDPFGDQPPKDQTTEPRALPSGSHQPIQASIENMAKAFEAWENNLRADPGKFMTAEEVAAAGVSQLSADRAAYFCSLLEAA